MRQRGGPPAPSAGLRAALLTVASLHVLLASGEAFGWTALRPVLTNTGFFDRYDEVVRAQKLNLVSTLGIAANALCKLPLGIFLDSCGPRWTSMLGSVMVITGALLMAWGDSSSVLHQGTGYFLLGASGPFIQMSCFQFSNLMPGIKTSIISFMICLFELSTGVFYVFSVANRMLGLGREELFTMYAGCGVFTFVTAMVMWPDTPYELPPAAPQEEYGSGGTEEKHQDEQPETVATSSSAPLHQRSFLQQLWTWEFAYLLIFFCVHNFTQGLVMTTMGLQVDHFFPTGGTADMLAEVFSVVLPLGFLPVLLCTFAGISGFILSRFQLAFVVTTVLSCLYGGLFLLPSIPAYVLLFVDFPVARQFCFSTFISYSAETFGYRTFGSINGLASTVAGIVQLGQSWVVQQAVIPHGLFGWEELDYAMAIVPVFLVIPPFAIWCRSSSCCSAAIQEDANGVTDTLLDGEGTPDVTPDIHSMQDGAPSVQVPGMVPRLGSLVVSYPIARSLSASMGEGLFGLSPHGR